MDKAVLFGGIIPLSNAELETKVREAGHNLSTPLIPTVALKLGWVKGKYTNGFPMDLLPTESQEDQCGFGTFPLIETVGNLNPEMPDSDELEKQLCLLLTKLSPTNNVAVHRLEALLEPDSFPGSTSGIISFSWPEYRGPLTERRNTVAPGL